MPPMRSVPENPSADPHPRTPAASPPPPPPPPPRPPTPPARRDTRGPLYTVPAHKRFKLIERSCRARSATYAILSQDPLVKELAYTATPYYYTSDVRGFVPALDCHGLPCTGPELPIEEQRLVCKLCSDEVRPCDGFTLLGSWVRHKKGCGERAWREKKILKERQSTVKDAVEKIKREKREAEKARKQERDTKKQKKKAEKEKDLPKEKGDGPPVQAPEEVQVGEEVRDDWRVVDWAEEVGVTEITEGITQVKMRVVKKRR